VVQIESPTVTADLDQVLGLAIEEMLGYCFERDLLDGIAIGVLRDGTARVGVAGKGVSEQSIFEIGSITKVFTAELIDILVTRGAMRWDDPVALYLSDELKAKHAPATDTRSITLMDLANHHSGLPLLPPHMNILDRDNTYGYFSRADLEQYLHTIELKLPASPKYSYSNVGYALLGYAIENAAKQRYEHLLHEELLLPMGLTQTNLALISEQPPEIIQGHAQAGRPTRRWTQDAFAPAGALCSTMQDMLCLTQFVLDHPKRRALGYGSEVLNEKTVLGWEVHALGHSFYRSGLTGGFSSYCSVSPELGYGLVLLANRSSLFLMRALSLNLERQLRGLPTIPLHGNYGKLKANILDYIRRGNTAGHLFRMIRSTKYGSYVLDRLRRVAQ
jgi:D-alanyl-D-alanine-carboxypeptidase/D-alanyl-D-alanine-endopeptidase